MYLKRRILEARYRAVRRRINSYTLSTAEAFKPVYRMKVIVRLLNG
jgi:hypothetical protein